MAKRRIKTNAVKWSVDWYWERCGYELKTVGGKKAIYDECGKLYCIGLEGAWERILARETFVETFPSGATDPNSYLTIKGCKESLGVPSKECMSPRSYAVLIKARDRENNERKKYRLYLKGGDNLKLYLCLPMSWKKCVALKNKLLPETVGYSVIEEFTPVEK